MTALRARLALALGCFLALIACTNEENLGARSTTPSGDGGTDAGTPSSPNTTTIEKEWTGQPIDVRSEGLSIALPGDGIEIAVDPSATRITATAELRPDRLFDLDGGPADAATSSSSAPPGSFTASEEGGTLVFRCTSAPNLRNGGCAKVTVVVPPGTTSTPLAVDVTNRGAGKVLVSGRGAILSRMSVKTSSDIEATLPANKGSEIDLDSSGGGDVTLKLPASFAADEITLSADLDSIDTHEFPDVESGTGRGPSGTGAKYIRLTSAEFAGSTGSLVLQKD